MKGTMKAVRIDAPHSASLVEVAIPEPPRGFARIRLKASAICATDLEVIDGNIPARYPLIPGHEWSGIVDAVGDPADAHWLGKAVIGINDVVCHTCEACRSGNWRYCKDFKEIGFALDGAYAEYMIAPTYGLYEKPESVSFPVAALCEPLGVALGTLEKAGARAGDTLMIMGAGSIGLCVLAAARAMGMRRIVVCASTHRRLKFALQLGAYGVIATGEQDLMAEMAKLHPDGTDLIVDATGIESCIQSSLKLLKKGGTLALAGYGRGKVMQIRIDDIHINNLKVVGAGNNWNKHKQALALMEDGLVDLSCFITRTLRLEDYEEGWRLTRTRPENFLKAVFLHE